LVKVQSISCPHSNAHDPSMYGEDVSTALAF